jgi:hypothetical protein
MEDLEGLDLPAGETDGGLPPPEIIRRTGPAPSIQRPALDAPPMPPPPPADDTLPPPVVRKRGAARP